MIRIVNYAMLAILFALVASAYKVTYAVRQSEAQIKNLRTEIGEERKRLQVLRADWEYLNSPQLLERWARRLSLRPMSANQVITFAGLPMPDAGTATDAEKGSLVLAVSRETGATPEVRPRPKPRFFEGGAR